MLSKEKYEQCMNNLDELIALNKQYVSLLQKQKLGIQQHYDKEKQHELRDISNDAYGDALPT